MCINELWPTMLLLKVTKSINTSWLSAVPTKNTKYVLNKEELRDAICMSY